MEKKQLSKEEYEQRLKKDMTEKEWEEYKIRHEKYDLNKINTEKEKKVENKKEEKLENKIENKKTNIEEEKKIPREEKNKVADEILDLLGKKNMSKKDMSSVICTAYRFLKEK